MDKVTPAARSLNMSRIRSRDTAPELLVRRAFHRKGLRFRLHARDLPGMPDLVFRNRRACVFVHGCFWHGCPKCVDGTRTVKSNKSYWSAKIEGNRARDVRHAESLQDLGWSVFVIWECELKNPKLIANIATRIKAIKPSSIRRKKA